MAVRNIKVQLYNVPCILRIEERTTILCISRALQKEEQQHAVPINLRRSKFHSGTGFSPPYFLEKCTSCPVEGKLAWHNSNEKNMKE